MLAHVFENFRNTCFKMYQLDPTKFLSALGLAWQAALKKTKVRLDSSTNIDLLLMVEKSVNHNISNLNARNTSELVEKDS